LNRQRGFTLLEMLAALAVLAVCSSVLVVAFGNSARALQQVQRSDRLSLVARSLIDDASDRILVAGRSNGEWSGVRWQMEVSEIPGANGSANAFRLDLQVDDGVRHARHSTLQVRSAGSGAGQ
jgi:general secretion pathway protein I